MSKEQKEITSMKEPERTTWLDAYDRYVHNLLRGGRHLTVNDIVDMAASLASKRADIVRKLHDEGNP